jgi:hypothetical protein
MAGLTEIPSGGHELGRGLVIQKNFFFFQGTLDGERSSKLEKKSREKSLEKERRT